MASKLDKFTALRRKNAVFLGGVGFIGENNYDDRTLLIDLFS